MNLTEKEHALIQEFIKRTDAAIEKEKTRLSETKVSDREFKHMCTAYYGAKILMRNVYTEMQEEDVQKINS